MKSLINSNRDFLKDYLRLEYDFSKKDQNQGVSRRLQQKHSFRYLSGLSEFIGMDAEDEFITNLV